MKIVFFLLLAANLIFLGLYGLKPLETSKPPSPTPLHPERITLLREPSAGAGPPTAGVGPTQTVIDPSMPDPTAPGPAAPAAICLVWDGLNSNLAPEIERRLAALTPAVDFSIEPVEAPRGYWAYLPPQGSREQAMAVVEQLKALGVNDYQVIWEPGPWQYAISLGLFNQDGAARQQALRLRQLGLADTQSGPRLRPGTPSRLRLGPVSPARLTELGGALPQGVSPPQTVPCP